MQGCFAVAAFPFLAHSTPTACEKCVCTGGRSRNTSFGLEEWIWSDAHWSGELWHALRCSAALTSRSWACVAGQALQQSDLQHALYQILCTDGLAAPAGALRRPYISTPDPPLSDLGHASLWVNVALA